MCMWKTSSLKGLKSRLIQWIGILDGSCWMCTIYLGQRIRLLPSNMMNSRLSSLVILRQPISMHMQNIYNCFQRVLQFQPCQCTWHKYIYIYIIVHSHIFMYISLSAFLLKAIHNDSDFDHYWMPSCLSSSVAMVRSFGSTSGLGSVEPTAGDPTPWGTGV